jgi:hypothetical protein
MAKTRQAHSRSPAASEPRGSQQITHNALLDLEHGRRQLTADDQRKWEEDLRLLRAARVRVQFKWPWGAGAEYLYRELIRALGLEHMEEELLRLAKSKPGRKEERELFQRIVRLKLDGKTVRQIQAELERDGRSISKEAIESYLKTRRRKKQPQHFGTWKFARRFSTRGESQGNCSRCERRLAASLCAYERKHC